MIQHPLVPIIRRRLLLFGGLLAFLLACAIFHDAALAVCPMLFMPPGVLSVCVLFTDDYSTDRTGTDYSTRSGSWSVGSGKITCTSASALIVETTATGAGATAAWATADLTPASTSDLARLILGYVDDSNYWFAELQPGASNGTLKLFQRSTGTNTQKGSTYTVTGYTSGTKTVCLCYVSGEVTATISGVGVTFAGTVTIASTKAGLGTGAGSTSVSFDNFSLNAHHKDDSTCQPCCPGACANCNTKTYPNYVQAVWTGVANSGCTDCGTLNATFVIPAVGTTNCYFEGGFANALTFCGGLLGGYGPFAAYTSAYPTIFQTIPHQFGAGFSVGHTYDCALGSDPTYPIDCSADQTPTSKFAVDFLGTNTTGIGSYCSTAAASVTVSAL